MAARDGGADFAVLGPVFETATKLKYGLPLGVGTVARISNAVRPFPVLALGGISQENAIECLRAGVCGVAGISLFGDLPKLRSNVVAIRDEFGSE